MSTGRLIITTPNADIRTINRLLLYIRDWPSSEDPYWDQQHIHFTVEDANTATTGNLYEPDLRILKPTSPPLNPPLPQNEWLNLSITQVEEIMFPKKECGLFLLLDDEGIQTQTLIIAHHAMDVNFETGETTFMDGYSKVRVPWDEVHMMWCNLSIANMGFDEFCVEEKLNKENGFWWTYKGKGFLYGEEKEREMLERRGRVLRELEGLGLA